MDRVVINIGFTTEWNDEFSVIYYPVLVTEHISLYTLSKRALLQSFAKLDKISEIHMVILDCLSKTTSMRFLVSERQLTINLHGDHDIKLKSNWEQIWQLFEPAVIKRTT